MSAWVVRYNHINAMVHYVQVNRILQMSPNILGQLLWNENVKTVNYRYREEDIAEEFVYNPLTAKVLTPLEILKACNCLSYQSCEHPEWETSEAYKLINSIKDSAICKLPEYDEVEWGID